MHVGQQVHLTFQFELSQQCKVQSIFHGLSKPFILSRHTIEIQAGLFLENLQALNRLGSMLGDERADKTRKKWGRPLKPVLITNTGILG